MNKIEFESIVNRGDIILVAHKEGDRFSKML